MSSLRRPASPPSAPASSARQGPGAPWRAPPPRRPARPSEKALFVAVFWPKSYYSSSHYHYSFRLNIFVKKENK